MIIKKSPADIDKMAAAGAILVRTMDLLAGKIRPGVTTAELDRAAEKFIRSQGATPAFKGYRGFPGSICASPNDMVVHGIPGKFKLSRGDVLSVSQIAFAKPATTTVSTTSPTKMLGYAKYAAVGLGALLFLFFMRRNLKRREREVFGGQPTWLRELETPRPLAALAGGVDDQPTDIKRLRSPVNVPKRQVEELVERDPDRVAQQVRAWMNED